MIRIAAVFSMGALTAVAAAQTYTVQDLGTIGGQSEAFALDGFGYALGTSVAADSHFRAVLFGGSPAVVPAPAGYSEHVAFAADGAGWIYGTAYTLGAMSPMAFRADMTGATPLGPFAARSANAAGDVAGTMNVVVTGLTLPRACVLRAGVLSALPTLGGLISEGLAIDDSGRVVGSASTLAEASVRPCAWVNGAAHDLGTLGGAGGQAVATRGAYVVGHSQNAAGLRRATLWQLDGAGNVVSRTDLGAIGASSSMALGLNGGVSVVGTSDYRAVLWQGGQTVALASRVSNIGDWTLDKAWAISDTGVIVGGGTLLGFPRAFRLAPCQGAAIAQQPVSATACPTGSAEFFVTLVQPSGAETYLWQHGDPAFPGVFVNLSDGPTPSGSVISGATTATLQIAAGAGGHLRLSDAGLYRVDVSDGCGTTTSEAAMLTVCVADYNCDGFLDGIDYDLFNADFENYNLAQQLHADISGDGFVDGIDYDQFNYYFETGC